MLVDAILSGIGLLAPPVFDFIKKKFISSKADSVETTVNTLATTHPESVEKFVNAQARLLEAKAKYFNRDVVGEVSLWVRNLRACIRPIYVIGGLVTCALCGVYGWVLDPCIRYSMDTCLSSWFGSRMVK